jgi:acylphosphatase
MTGSAEQFVSAEFEVYGKVQGCYFTKYVKEQSETLGCAGWVKNSKAGTVLGKIQGLKPAVDEMIEWMTKTGSPGCSIERCETRNWEVIMRPDFRNFSIRF